MKYRPDGEIGRHSGLKIRRNESFVGVQVPLRAPNKTSRMSYIEDTRPLAARGLVSCAKAMVPLLVQLCSGFASQALVDHCRWTDRTFRIREVSGSESPRSHPRRQAPPLTTSRCRSIWLNLWSECK